MPAIHSSFNQAEGVEAIGMKLLPIKSKVKGTAPPAPDDKEDIVDEVNQSLSPALFWWWKHGKLILLKKNCFVLKGTATVSGQRLVCVLRH